MRPKWAKAKLLARIGRRCEQSSGPEDPAWEWYIICWATSAYYSIFACDSFFRLKFVFISRLLALLLIIIINIGLAVYNLYGIWILEHKGATTLQKLGGGGNSGEARIRSAKRLRFEGGAQIEGKPQKKRWRGQGRGSVSPSLGFFFGISNFKSLHLVYGGKGNLFQKWGSIKIGGSWPLDPPLVAILLEQAVECRCIILWVDVAQTAQWFGFDCR